MDLNLLTVETAILGLKEKKFSSFDLVKSCLKQIGDKDKKIKAFVTVCKEEALKEAKEIDNLNYEDSVKEKPLLGIPFSIKDNFCTKDIKTTASSNVLKDYIPPYNATVYKKLNDSGAIILGKTNMDAWAHGSSTEASDFFTTRNPWDPERLPGGSSGGSAASIASDEAIFSIGSETAGSIRQPASWCGVVGLKPTYGRVSRYGVIAMASSLDSPGPITKTVKDAALILNVIAGSDGFDATCSEKEVEDYSSNLEKSIKDLKIGICEKYFQVSEKNVTESVKKALKIFEKLGAKIEEVDLFDPKYAIAVYTILQRSEVSSNLGRYDGIRYGKNRSFFGDEAKRRIMLGTYCLSSGYFDAYYLKAEKVRTIIVDDFKKAFEKVDVIVGPTTPSCALPLGSSKNHPMFGEVADVLVEPSTIAGLPGINVNCGFSPENLPVGLQIIGPQFSEAKILNAAYQFEKNINLNKPKSLI